MRLADCLLEVMQNRKQSSYCSQVLVVGRSFDILDVGFLRHFNAAVGQLLIADLIFAIEGRARASPVPEEASLELESRHLFVGEVGDDLEHVATVAVDAEDVFVDEVRPPDSLLEEERASDEATDNPLSLLGVFPDVSLHYYFIYYIISYTKHLSHYKQVSTFIAFKSFYSLIVTFSPPHMHPLAHCCFFSSSSSCRSRYFLISSWALDNTSLFTSRGLIALFSERLKSRRMPFTYFRCFLRSSSCWAFCSFRRSSSIFWSCFFLFFASS